MEERSVAFSLMEMSEVVDALGIEAVLGSILLRLNNPQEEQKVYEILQFCKDHTFGKDVQL